MRSWFLPLVLATINGQNPMMMTTKLAIVQGPTATEIVQKIEPAEAPISLSFRSLQPGEAILARLRDDASVKRVVLSLGDQVRVLEPAAGDSPGSPLALLGIDLGKKPQSVTLKVKTERLDGKTASVELPLTVAPREFPSTRLDVAPSMTCSLVSR